MAGDVRVLLAWARAVFTLTQPAGQQVWLLRVDKRLRNEGRAIANRQNSNYDTTHQGSFFWNSAAYIAIYITNRKTHFDLRPKQLPVSWMRDAEWRD